MIKTINVIPRQLEFEQHEAVKRLIFNYIRDLITTKKCDEVIKDCLVIQMSDIIKDFFAKYELPLGDLNFVTKDKDLKDIIYFIYYGKDDKDITYKVEVYDWEITGVTIIKNIVSDIGAMRAIKCTKRETYTFPVDSYRHKIDIIYKMYSYKMEY